MTESLARLKEALADRYMIEREIGSGATATVYLARDLKHERQVALKVLAPELAAALGKDRFLQEIKIAASLHHPHILALYDSGEADGFLYFVMPYAEGESLRDRIRREKQLAIDDALQIAREVADALSYAHSHGVIHRDIKPENILLESGHAVVADFGIARAIDVAGGERLTETGIAVGTPQYMSPEQAGGEKEIDGRSDLYALGCVLHEMLAGQPPFTGPTVESLVVQHLSAEPPSVTSIRPSVPGWVATALERSLAKTPADRFNPVALFGEAIAPRASVATAGARTVSVNGRPRWLMPSVLAGAAALIVVTWVLARTIPSGPITITTSNFIAVTHDPGLEFQPAISPNGSEVAFVAGPIGNPRIQVKDASGVGGNSRLGSDLGGYHWLPRWSPDGASVRFLACAATQPIGIPRGCGDWKEVGKLGGLPRAVDVPRASNTYAWSRDGSRMAFVAGDSILAYSADHGEALLAVHEEGPLPLHSLTWSPDGQWIAFVAGNGAWRNSTNLLDASIWIVDASGGEPVPVAVDGAMNVSPQWLPDSRHLLFVSNRDGGARGIYVVETGPEGPRGPPQAVPGASDPHSISISENGSRLAYSSLPAKQNIWSIPIPLSGSVSIEDAVPVSMGNQTIEEFDLSPDGEWIVFSSNLGGESDLYLQPVAGGAQSLVAPIAGHEFSPAWSPDGTEIAYYNSGSEAAGWDADLFIVSAQGGTPHPLKDFPGNDMNPDWSPDGLSIAYQSQGPNGEGQHGLWLLERDGIDMPWGEPERLTEFSCQFPHWAPDGTSLLCDTVNPRGWVRVSRDGDVLVRYDPSAFGLRSFWAPQFSPDGSRIFVRASHENGSQGVWWIPASGGSATQVIVIDDPSRHVTNKLRLDRESIYLVITEYESDIRVMDLEW